MHNGKIFHGKWPNNWLEKFCNLKYENIIRPSCFNCKFKYPNTPGDFIVGDSWGIDKNRHGFRNDRAGVVFCMNEKAEKLF